VSSKLSTTKSIQKIEDTYPKLFNELHDSNSAIPAYVRFQNQDGCLLREDLKKLKAAHFKKNYEKQLSIPKKYLDEVHFDGGDIDASKYFQMKYYLSDEMKNNSIKSKVAEISVG